MKNLILKILRWLHGGDWSFNSKVMIAADYKCSHCGKDIYVWQIDERTVEVRCASNCMNGPNGNILSGCDVQNLGYELLHQKANLTEVF